MAKITACDICGEIFKPSSKRFSRTSLFDGETGRAWDLCNTCQEKHIDNYLIMLKVQYKESRKNTIDK